MCNKEGSSIGHSSSQTVEGKKIINEAKNKGIPEVKET